MALDTTPLTETSAFTPDICPPLANSAIASADVAASLQKLANRTLFLNDRRPRLYSDAGDDADGSPGFFATFNSSSYTDGPFVDVPNVEVGDVIIVRAALLCVGDFTNVARLRLRNIDDFAGTPTGELDISGAVTSISQPATTSTWIQVSLQGRVEVTEAGTTRVKIVGKAFTNAINVQTYALDAEHYKT